MAAIRHKGLSRNRDKTTAELNRQLGGLRQIVDLALGKGSAAALLDLKGRTERRQDGICRQAVDVLIRLDELAPRDPVMAGVSNDPVVWKSMIEPSYRRLEDLRQLVLVREVPRWIADRQERGLRYLQRNGPQPGPHLKRCRDVFLEETPRPPVPCGCSRS